MALFSDFFVEVKHMAVLTPFFQEQLKATCLLWASGGQRSRGALCSAYCGKLTGLLFGVFPSLFERVTGFIPPREGDFFKNPIDFGAESGYNTLLYEAGPRGRFKTRKRR